MNLDLHKELYFFEWTRKEQLYSYTNLPVALLTALAGGTLYLIDTFPYSHGLVADSFVLFSVLSISLQVVAIVYVFRSLSGYWYEQIPSPDKLQKYYEDLKQYHAALGNQESDAQKEFNDFLRQRLAEATTANRKNNTRTGQSLERALKCIVFALALAGVSFVPYLGDILSHKDDVQKIQIQGPVQIQSEKPMPRQDPQPQPPPQRPATPQPQPPVRPQAPPNEEVRKGGGMREKR